jgi:anti-sigma regulatory factor (Ser/Thr protein kinase)
MLPDRGTRALAPSGVPARVADARSFPNIPSAVADARQFTREQLVDEADPDLVDEIVTMVSELAANCVQHARTQFRVVIDCRPHEISVEVADDGAGAPTSKSPGPTEVSGRGLLIVSRLASSWGVRSSGVSQGKTVWFTVAIPFAQRVAESP